MLRCVQLNGMAANSRQNEERMAKSGVDRGGPNSCLEKVGKYIRNIRKLAGNCTNYDRRNILIMFQGNVMMI